MPLDSLAVVGEVMSWIGLGVGLPMLVIGRLLRAPAGDWQAVEITVVEQQGRLVARWLADGVVHERPLRPREAHRIGEGWYAGQVSGRNTDRIQFTNPSGIGPTLSTLGRIFVAAGVVGFVVSWLPVFG